MGTPWGLAASFLPPALRMAPVTSGVDGREGLPSLVQNEFHRMLEGTANRERREKAAEQMLKRAPPQDPPVEYDLARRRGGLGE